MDGPLIKRTFSRLPLGDVYNETIPHCSLHYVVMGIKGDSLGENIWVILRWGVESFWFALVIGK